MGQPANAQTVLAEKVPDEFSGILAGAPGINWSKFLVSEAWGYVVASEKGQYDPIAVTFRTCTDPYS